MKKYIYLDTKIIGAIKQTINYFNEEVFDKDNTIIIWKEYFKKKFRIKYLFNKYKIKNIPFKKYSELPLIKDGDAVFYLFNAQSNTRMVANRNIKHIFVTHGESNKISSIKPITRIYDYVTVAGQLGIDRFIENKIFTKCEIDQGKIIKMGNTFIGNIGLFYDENSENVLYAPTWEGGIKEENYSSISKDLKNIEKIINFMLNYKKENLIIQPHPNLGHRDRNYKRYLLNIIKYAQFNNINVFLKNWELSFFDKLKLKNKVYDFYELKDKSVFFGFCDISAIETQLLDKGIPYYIFIKNIHNVISKNKLIFDYYNKLSNLDLELTKELTKKMANYYISYEDEKLKNISKYERVKWLINRINKD